MSRLIYGARLTLGAGLAATAVNVLVALVVGGISGFIGGRLDLTVQRFVDAWMSIPGLLILLTVMSVVGRGVLQIIVVLGVLGGIGGSRVVRGAVIAAKENVYFEAARAVGSSRWRTLVHHLLPNIAPVLIVIYSINIGAVVISEASLSFLGFGLPTTVPSWGGMLSREGRQYMEIAPRLAVWPGLCLTVVVYCLNMVGDAVRDLLDPRLRGGSGRLGAYGAQESRGDSTARAEITHPDRGASHKGREAGRPLFGRRLPDVILGAHARRDRIAATENAYFEAARAVGSSRWRTLVRHLVLRAGGTCAGAWRCHQLPRQAAAAGLPHVGGLW